MHFLGIRETIDVVYVATFHEVIYIVSLLWTRERCSPGKLPHIMDLVIEFIIWIQMTWTKASTELILTQVNTGYKCPILSY